MQNLAVRLSKCRGYRNDGPSMYDDYIGNWVFVEIISRRNTKTNKGSVVMRSKEYPSGKLYIAKKKAEELAEKLNIPCVEISEWD